MLHIQNPSLNHPRIAFIEASWHADIVQQAGKSFSASLDESGVKPTIDWFQVPGSLEIPLLCKRLAEQQKYDLIVAAGLIVDGGIYRHDFVASSVLDGMMRVQLDCNIPIVSVVLTPHHFQESAAHLQFFTEHFVVKGAEAANACCQMLELDSRLSVEAA